MSLNTSIIGMHPPAVEDMGGITHPTPKAAAAFDCVPNGSSVNWVPLWDVIQGRSGRGGYGPKRPFPTLTVGHFRS